MKTEGEIGVMHYKPGKSKDGREPPEAQRIKEEYFPRSLGGSMALTTFGFRLQSLRTVRE